MLFDKLSLIFLRLSLLCELCMLFRFSIWLLEISELGFIGGMKWLLAIWLFVNEFRSCTANSGFGADKVVTVALQSSISFFMIAFVCPCVNQISISSCIIF